MSRELFAVEVSADRMEASISLTRAGMEAVGVQPADLLSALKAAGVIFGVHPGTVDKAAREFRSADRNMLPIPVAFGAEPTAGGPHLITRIRQQRERTQTAHAPHTQRRWVLGTSCRTLMHP